MSLDIKPLSLRLIRVELDTGEIEVLITSLLDKKRYPQVFFKDLYHKRWSVEIDYFFMKQRLEIGNFSGTTSLSVYQDFHAKVATKNLAVILASPVQEAIKQDCEENKYDSNLSKIKRYINTSLRPAI